MSSGDTKKTSTTEKDRMHFRLDPKIKARVVRAAAVTGQGLTDFAVSTLSEKANQILERYDNIVLRTEDHSFFLGALGIAKKPTRRSRTAAERYRKGRRKGVSYHFDS